MAIAFIASTYADFSSPGWTTTGVTTPTVDTTGANLLVVSFGWADWNIPTNSVSDNKGNTWIGLTVYRNFSSSGTQFFYAKNAIVGAGHTFTVSSSAASSPTVIVHAFANVDTTAPFDKVDGLAGGTSGPLSGGTVTPAVNNSLVIATLRHGNATVSTITVNLPNLSKNAGNATAYDIQTTITTVNPQWNFSGGTDNAVASVAVFKPAAATDIRVTQDVIETLSLPFPAIRTSQYVVELLSSSVSTAPVSTETTQFVIIM